MNSPRRPSHGKKGRKRVPSLPPAAREVSGEGDALVPGWDFHEQSPEIQALIDLARRNKLSELEVERAGARIRIRFEAGSGDTSAVIRHVTAAAAEIQDAAPVVPPRGEAEGYVTVTSPIVGTFYRSPSPDADPYVEEGDYVRKGQVLCIVEAMKLMNEIESEVDGRVARILVESTKPVEYGQPLFLIDPELTA